MATTKKPIKIKRPGALHRKTGTPMGKKIPYAKKLAAAHSKNPLTRKEGQFALNFNGKGPKAKGSKSTSKKSK